MSLTCGFASFSGSGVFASFGFFLRVGGSSFRVPYLPRCFDSIFRFRLPLGFFSDFASSYSDGFAGSYALFQVRRFCRFRLTRATSDHFSSRQCVALNERCFAPRFRAPHRVAFLGAIQKRASPLYRVCRGVVLSLFIFLIFFRRSLSIPSRFVPGIFRAGVIMYWSHFFGS